MRMLHLDTLPALLRARSVESHKGDFGVVGIIGGAPGMSGAALLAGKAALLCGCGRVYVGLLDDRLSINSYTPELMLTPPGVAMNPPAPGCLIIGPGLGQSGAAHEWLKQGLQQPLPLILDADALNLLAADSSLLNALSQRTAATLITPHPGEAARLLDNTPHDIQADRTQAARQLAARFHASVVLKGHHTLVLDQQSTIWQNTTGNPGMAAPGMGDVLAGIIAGLCAQGLSLDHAALLGVWLHGAAGDAAVAAGKGPVGLTASEVIDEARRILNKLPTA